MNPTVVFPNIVAKVEKGLEKGYFAGEKVYKMRDTEKVYGRELEITTGDFHTWDDMEEMWKHTFKRLKVNPAQVNGVVITGRASDTDSRKEEIVQSLFES